jgi:hypothetical protein
LRRPAFTPIPTRADDASPPANPNPVFTVTDKGIYIYHRDGNVYLLDPTDLSLRARAFYVPPGNPNSVFLPGNTGPAPTFVPPQ